MIRKPSQGSDRVALPSLTKPPLTGTQGIFAQKRKGKSYLAQSQAEDYLAENMQLAAVDPTGAWWGLQSSADGTAPGYPITIFGGEHGNAPLEVKSGALIAEAMVTERFSAVLDLSLLDAEDWPIVTGDFLDTLYKLNRIAMHVYLDEADQFAPQTPNSKAQQKCRTIVSRLVRLGGIKGIGCTVITQRTALLDKNITEQCDTIVALRMNGARDIDSLRRWMANHVNRKLTDEILSSLGSLPRGQAWVMSPGAETFELQQVRTKRTFDSGRTPEPGEILTPPKALAPVDVARLGAAIAATVEKAKANDPVALKARVAELEAALAGSDHLKAKHAYDERLEQLTQRNGKLIAENMDLIKLVETSMQIMGKAQRMLGSAIGEATAVGVRIVPDTIHPVVVNGERNERAISTFGTTTPTPAQVADVVEKRRTRAVPPKLETQPVTDAAVRALVNPDKPLHQYTVGPPPDGRSVEAHLDELAKRGSPASPDSGKLPKAAVAFLTVLAQRGPQTRRKILIYSRYTRSGATDKAFGELANSGFINATSTGATSITFEGLAFLRASGDIQPLVKQVEMPTAHRKFLIVLAHYGPLSRRNVLLFAGYTRSGATDAAFADIVADDWVDTESNGHLAITQDGLDALGEWERTPPFMGEAFRRQIAETLNTAARKFFEYLCDRMTAAPTNRSGTFFTRQDILAGTKYKRSGATDEAFALLVRRDYVITGDRNALAANPELFRHG